MSDLNPSTSEQVADQSQPVEETLGPAGLDALQKEREERRKDRDARRIAEQRLQALEQQLAGLDPEQLRSFKELQEQREKLEADLDQRVQRAAEEARSEVLQQVKIKDQKLAEALAEKSELYRKQALANAFQAAGGRTGGADDGITYFDALMGAVGGRFKVNDAGDVMVTNANGDAMLTDNGDPITPTAYLEQLKSHPVYGHFFAPTSTGHGGGMRGSGNLTTGNLSGMSAMDKISFGLGS